MNMKEQAVILQTIYVSDYSDNIMDALCNNDWDKVIKETSDLIKLCEALNKVMEK